MKKFFTVSDKDPAVFDKMLIKAVIDHPGAHLSYSSSAVAIPFQEEPVAIPGMKMPPAKMNVQVINIYCCTLSWDEADAGDN